MSKRRAPWVPAPWDWAGQCVALTEDYSREFFGGLAAVPKLNQGAAA